MDGSTLGGERVDDRTVLAVTGTERREFLQGLVTNDVNKLDEGLVYAALLTPQGKYLADFFLAVQGDSILIDVATPLAPDLFKRLRMYKLRADVALSEASLYVRRGPGAPPPGAWADPRHPDLGWRAYTPEPGGAPVIDWDAVRVAHCIPESLVELKPNETFILEAGFERLAGVDFRKGCYVGQEVTARMKHKTELRKGIASVGIDGAAPPSGTEILAGGKVAGTLFTVAGTRGLAHLRFDRAGDGMEAGTARVSWTPDGG